MMSAAFAQRVAKLNSSFPHFLRPFDAPRVTGQAVFIQK